MADSPQLVKRLKDLLQYIDELTPIAAKSLVEFEGDYFVHHTAAHLIELIVECGIDINKVIMDEEGRHPAADYRGTFLEMASLGILPADLSRELAAYVSLRNEIAHEYEQLTHKEVFEAIPGIIRAFSEFAGIIQQRLSPL